MADRKITDLGVAQNEDLLNNPDTVLPIVNPNRANNIDKNRKATFANIASAMVDQGLVEGPASSVDGRVALFNGVEGTLLKQAAFGESDVARLSETQTFTGAKTFSAQLTSTVTTGTAPFVVASTTQVSNLNASQLIGGTWAAPGTIGSTTANTGAFTTLSASTSVSTPLVTRAGTLALAATGANIITASTNGVERVRVTSAGDVGIGGTPLVRGHVINNGGVGNDVEVFRASSEGAYLGVNVTPQSSGQAVVSLLSWSGGGGNIGSAAFAFRTRNVGVEEERMRITSAGKIQASAGTNWVGTVSQSSTSAVVESGSNANGQFVKFADGTLICNHAISLGTAAISAGAFEPASGSNGVEWTLPVAAVSGRVVAMARGDQMSTTAGLLTIATNRHSVSGAEAYRVYALTAHAVGWGKVISFAFNGRWY